MTDRSGDVSPPVALLILLARVLTIAGWPAFIAIALTLIIVEEINPAELPGFLISLGVLLTVTFVAVADWLRRHILSGPAHLAGAEWIQCGREEARAQIEALRAHIDQRLNSMTNILVEHGLQPAEQPPVLIPGDNVLAFELGRQVGRDNNHNGGRKPH